MINLYITEPAEKHMINVRQIETLSITFNQYKNGIDEIIYHECSLQAVEQFSYFLGLSIKEKSSNDTGYILCNLSQTHPKFLEYHFAQIKKFDSMYTVCQRPDMRFATLYPQMTPAQKIILGFMQSLELPRIKLNMFSVNDYQKAVSWLLSGL